MKLKYLAFVSLALAAGTVQAGDARKAKAETITLACVANDGFTFAVEIDEVRNLVRYNGTPATNVLIDRNQVIFDVDMAGEVWTHSLSRLTGTLVAQQSSTGAVTSPYTCKRAAPKF